MFKPLPLQHVTLHVLAEDAPLAALVLAEYGLFNPEKAAEEALPDLPAEYYGQLVKSIEARLHKILSYCDIAIEPAAAPLRPIPEEELARLDRWLTAHWSQYSHWLEAIRRLTEEQKAIDQLMMILVSLLDLNIDLSWLKEPKRFLDVRIGTAPLANVPRLREALGLAGYVLDRFLERNGQAYLILAGPISDGADVNNVLRAAGWRVLPIPPEFRGYPDKVRQELLARRARVLQDKQAVQDKIAQSVERHRAELAAALHTLTVAKPYAELREALRGRGGLAVLTGWVPKREVAKLESTLRDRLKTPLALAARDPLPGEAVPSLIQHHPLLRPFVTLVKNYGIPRYGEFDPTLLFTFSFIIMFGMMFGDAGQGAVIAIAGLLLRRRLKGFAPFVMAVGLSSVAFGFLYGSVFGFETLIPALWMPPLSDPILMLKMALYWGIGFILLVTGLTVYNRLGEGRLAEALWDGKGLAGLLFYLGLIYGGWRWLGQGRFGALETLAVLLPLGIVFIYRWRQNPIPLGERILVVFIEGFETVLAYLSGTLSFLRVAAFSLNHVALAIAVFTLAEKLGTAGHWATVVLGNLFILGLEGAIVTIQALRLEYYEGFSRFFRGDGREFRPLTLASEEWRKSF